MKANRTRGLVFVILALGLVVSLVVAACAQATPTSTPTATATPTATPKPTASPTPPQEVFKWRWQVYDTPGAASWPRAIEPFVENVEAMSDGRIQIEVFPGEALVPTREILDAVSMGTIEMGRSTPSYWAGTIPEAGLLNMPMAAPTWLANGTMILDHGIVPIVREAYAKHNVYWIGTVTAGPVYTWFKDEVRTLEDFKGKKIRFFGLYNDLMDMLGAQSVSLPHAESYLALQLGTVDGYGTGANRYMELKHFELAPYFVRTPAFGIAGNEIMVNMDVWNSLPDDLKAVLQVATEAMEYDYGRYFHEDINTLFLKKGKEYGTIFVDLPLEDVAQITKVASQIWDEVGAKSPGAAQIVSIMKEYLGVE